MEKFKKFIPMIVGVVLLGLGVFFFFRNQALVANCTEPATATVVDMREDFDTTSDGFRYMYYPIIEYVVSGRTIATELGSGSNAPAYRINETLEILYNPTNVEEFIVAGENQNIIWIILLALGAVFVAVGVYVVVKK